MPNGFIRTVTGSCNIIRVSILSECESCNIIRFVNAMLILRITLL